MHYVTIKEIANVLGISKSTVSRALSGDGKNVSDSLRQRILATADEMGYRRNELAVSLRSRHNRIIGIVVPEIITPFAMNIVAEVQRIVIPKGYTVSVASSCENPAEERRILDMFSNLRVAGILVSTCHDRANLAAFNALLARKVPLVFFDRVISELPAPSVSSNNYIKSFFLVEHLVRTGKRRILNLTGPRHIQNSLDRSRGYKDALDKFKIPFDPKFVRPCGVNVEDGIAEVSAALADGLQFDAVYCFTETQALGAKRCLQEHGFSIPQDVAIACMSGTVLSTLVYPQITAVEQQVVEMADVATKLLMDKINDFNTPDQSIILNAKMFVRGSTVESLLPAAT